MIKSLYAQELNEKTEQLSSDRMYHDVLQKFEMLGENEERSRSTRGISWTAFCILVAGSIGIIVVRT